MPRAVALPANAEQVSQVLALAYGEGVPVAGRGSGTGLSGGALAAPGGIQIAFTRMNRILEVDTENRTATIEPGVINLDLDTHVRKFGMRYAPDPFQPEGLQPGRQYRRECRRTPLPRLRHHHQPCPGNGRGVGGRYAGAPGRSRPGRCPATTCGAYFVGSEGTFGIATRITVRLLPLPETVKTFLGIFPDIESACSAVSAVIGHGIVPAALEMIDALSIRAVQNVTDAGYPDDAGAVLLIELEGLWEEVDEVSREVESALWETGASDVRIAEEDSERERLWLGRKTAFGAFGTIAPNYYLVDGVVPRTRLTQVLRKVSEVSEKYGIIIANVFHAGDGNLHPCMLFDEREPGVKDRAMAGAAELMEYCAEMGGSLSGEHGIGLEKKQFMPLVYTEAGHGDHAAGTRRFRPSPIASTPARFSPTAKSMYRPCNGRLPR